MITSSANDLKILICGMGSIGQQHMRTLCSLQVNPPSVFRTSSKAYRQEYPDHMVFHSLEEALGTQPDCVIICNPTSMHIDTAIRAVDANCDIFIEKPISHSLNNVAKLHDLLLKNNKICMTGYMYRYHPLVHQLKEVIADRRFGAVKSYYSYWGEYLPSWHPWEDYLNSYASRYSDGGGVSLTLSHDIDLAQFLMGDLTAIGRLEGPSALPIDVDQNCKLYFHSPDCQDIVVELNYLDEDMAHYILVNFQFAKIKLDFKNNEIVIHSDEQGFIKQKTECSRQNLFSLQFQDFINCIRKRKQPSCSLREGEKVLDLILKFHPFFKN